MKIPVYIALILLLATGCKENKNYDLAIENAKILDVLTGQISEGQTILIQNGKIEAIAPTSGVSKAQKTINANGRLVSPGFIDTHIHPTDVFGDYADAPEYLPEDSLGLLRQNLSDEYLTYGVTTALMLGQPEKWLEPILEWQKHPSPKYTDIYTSGGALISKEEREPYIGHLTLEDEKAAKDKTIEYFNKGIKHLKVYHRLREPELTAVLTTADSLNMIVFGHIGDMDPTKLNINHTLVKDLIHYEHIGMFTNSVITTQEDWDSFNKQLYTHFGQINSMEKYFMMLLETFRYIDEFKKAEADQLIKELAAKKATFSTTIGLFYQQFQQTFYTRPTENALTEEQEARSKENFKIFMKYAKSMHDHGIHIRIGTDTKQGGQVFLNELKILSDNGFPVADTFNIATINGAKALGIENNSGSIEVGKDANLIIWENSPFEDTDNWYADKIIIKNGEEYQKQM